ncbi:uncharacterized protein LOC144173529 [Haemaphysalis longicornis]
MVFFGWDQVPPNRVCSACGIVVRRTGLLLCGHCLCGTCHLQQRQLGGSLCCPLDGEACPQKRVQWTTFPAADMDRAVYCWNQDNGCSTIVALGQLTDHFYQECRHHTVACRKCSTKILYNSLCSHLRTCTGTQEPGLTEGAQVPVDNEQTTELTALKTTLSTATLRMERQLGDLKGLLERLSSEGNLQSGHMNELSHSMNDLKEAQTDQISDVSRTVCSLKEVQTNQGNLISLSVNNLKETLQRNLEAVISQNRNLTARRAADIDVMKDVVVETGKETFRRMDSILRHILRARFSHQWILKGYGSLKERALRAGSAERFANAVYLCHYLILPGVYLKRVGYEVSLHLQLCLKRGEVDEYLQWPFNRKMTLSVVHPDSGEKRSIQTNPDCRSNFYSRPTTPSNATFFIHTCLYLNDLEREGYVENDQLELCFTLLT